MPIIDARFLNRIVLTVSRFLRPSLILPDQDGDGDEDGIVEAKHIQYSSTCVAHSPFPFPFPLPFPLPLPLPLSLDQHEGFTLSRPTPSPTPLPPSSQPTNSVRVLGRQRDEMGMNEEPRQGFHDPLFFPPPPLPSQKKS